MELLQIKVANIFLTENVDQILQSLIPLLQHSFHCFLKTNNEILNVQCSVF